MSLTNQQMTAHVEALCIFLSVELRIIEGGKNESVSTERRIQVRPVRSEEDYCAALHEIGHSALFHRPEQSRQLKEIAAWAWARKAAVSWTPRMQEHSEKCLKSWGISEFDIQHPEKYVAPQSIL